MSLFIAKMDASPVQSGSKCGSDFSIARILAEREDSREDVPEWLCCTRYQPPRLPRAAVACRSRRAGRHARVPFTAAQAQALEAAYVRAPYLAPPALKALAAALQLRDDRCYYLTDGDNETGALFNLRDSLKLIVDGENGHCTATRLQFLEIIKIWFQNRRARERREKSTTIAPPRGITLPPTTTWKTQSHFGIPNDPVFFNSHKSTEAKESRISLNEFSHKYKGQTSFNCDSNQHYDSETNEDRPDTPLDIETVED